MDTQTIRISPDGTVEFVYADNLRDLLSLGEAEVVRVSHVEPMGIGWSADMSPVGGPLLTDNGQPFEARAEALAAERAWLAEHCGL